MAVAFASNTDSFCVQGKIFDALAKQGFPNLLVTIYDVKRSTADISPAALLKDAVRVGSLFSGDDGGFTFNCTRDDIHALSGGGLLPKPVFMKIGGQRVKSWNANTLIGASQDQMGEASLKIITARSNVRHPLADVLVNGAFKNGGNKAEWAKDARHLKAGHVRSNKAGGPDIIVLMSSKYNRGYSGDLELPGILGAMVLDEVLEIGDIGMDSRTA